MAAGKVWTGILLGAAALCAGCVNIQDNVQVDRTTATNTAQNITQKCDVKPYVCITIPTMGSASLSSLQNVGLVRDKAAFESVWNVLTVDSSLTYTKVQGTNQPQIDWNSQQAFFLSLGKVDNTCVKIVPIKVTTDCLNIFFTLSKVVYAKDCQSAESYPVFVYVMPRTDLPFQVLWSEDADGDGFSNDSEVKVGTDPLDANSHP